MGLNRFGEFVRTTPAPERVNPPEVEFANLYDAFGAQSNPPIGVEVPGDVFYWKGDRLQHYKGLFEKMNAFVQENNLTEVTHFATGESINVANFVNKIKRSIEFSEKVNS